METQEITDKEIALWKEKWGEVYEFVSEDGLRAWLRKPDRTVMAAALHLGTTDPLAFNELILRNCWLAGDKKIMESDDHLLGISAYLHQVVRFKEYEIKKH